MKKLAKYNHGMKRYAKYKYKIKAKETIVWKGMQSIITELKLKKLLYEKVCKV